MDGDDEYAACPTSFSETVSIPLPNLCESGFYNQGNFGCSPFYASSTIKPIQPHMGDAGIIGRPPIKSSHWSAANVPIEAVTYDPLPAECGDIEAHKCTSLYDGEYRFSVVDIQRLNDDGDTVKYISGPDSG